MNRYETNGDGTFHRPGEQLSNQFPHEKRASNWMATGFLLRLAVTGLICIWTVEWVFSAVNTLLALYLLPDLNAWNYTAALTHSPAILTDLVPMGIEILITVSLASRWILGFAAAALIAKTFYTITVRFLKMPLWSAYSDIFGKKG
ncbi:hypothetical protein JKG47_02935 [Acidithiobacillus sp. MC6.1]|nr:hypothetical protein [Acidithiobacillus sp. MC6.1]